MSYEPIKLSPHSSIDLDIDLDLNIYIYGTDL